MDKEKLKELAEIAIEDFFEGIDSVVEGMVTKIVEENKIEEEDDIDYIRKKIMHGILKLD